MSSTVTVGDSGTDLGPPVAGGPVGGLSAPDPTWSRRPTAAVGVLVVRAARAHSPLTPVGEDADGAVPELTAAAAGLVAESVGDAGTVTADAFSVTVDLPDADPRGVRQVLQAAARTVAANDLASPDGTTVRLHVGVGWADLSDRPRVTAVAAAQHAAAESLSHNDLVARPVLAGDGPLGVPRRPSTAMTRWQIALSLIACVAAPLAVMITTYRVGLDISTTLYWAAVSAIVLTVGLQFAEGFVALRRCAPPDDASAPPGGHRDHRRVPAERGGDDHRDADRLPRSALPRASADPARLQHRSAVAGRGRAGPDRVGRPPLDPAPGRAQYLQGPERQRRPGAHHG